MKTDRQNLISGLEYHWKALKAYLRVGDKKKARNQLFIFQVGLNCLAGEKKYIAQRRKK